MIWDFIQDVFKNPKQFINFVNKKYFDKLYIIVIA